MMDNQAIIGGIRYLLLSLLTQQAISLFGWALLDIVETSTSKLLPDYFGFRTKNPIY